MVGLKLDNFGGGMIGKRKGSGDSDGENLERMRSILSLKNWRNELARDCVSGVSGDELDKISHTYIENNVVLHKSTYVIRRK